MTALIIGWMGAFLNIAAFSLQLKKTLKDKDLRDLNQVTFMINIAGGTFWLCNSIVADAYQPGIVNSITILLQLGLVFIINKRVHKKNFLHFIIPMALLTLSLLTVMITNQFMNYIPTQKVASLVFGLLAGGCVASSFIPQVIKSLRLNSTESLSYGLIILYGTSQTIWTIFWFLRIFNNEFTYEQYLPGIIFSGLTAIMQLVLLTKKIKNRDK